jgi:hypothetical protein
MAYSEVQFNSTSCLRSIPQKSYSFNVEESDSCQSRHRKADRELCRRLSAKAFSDEKAKVPIDELAVIEKAEEKLQASYVLKLSKVLPRQIHLLNRTQIL